MKQIKEFDGVRAIAILSIVACHICYGIDSMSPLGQYLGGTFNFVFFILSGLLIGLSVNAHKSKCCKLNKFSFLKKRLLRLIPDLWIFLTLFLLVATFFDITYTSEQIVLNYLMFGWFAKLPYCGHLWFVTMILFCYVLFTVSLNVNEKRLFLVGLLILCIGGQVIFCIAHLPAYMFLILFLSGVTMIYSTDILYLIDKINMSIAFIITISINICYYLLINNGLLTIGNLDYYYMGGISGITMLVGLYKLFKKIPVSKFLTLVSALSYQIYLVHHPLCNTNYISRLVNSKFIAIILIVTISILLAYILKISGEFLMSRSYSKCSKINSSKS